MAAGTTMSTAFSLWLMVCNPNVANKAECQHIPDTEGPHSSLAACEARGNRMAHDPVYGAYAVMRYRTRPVFVFRCLTRDQTKEILDKYKQKDSLGMRGIQL